MVGTKLKFETEERFTFRPTSVDVEILNKIIDTQDDMRDKVDAVRLCIRLAGDYLGIRDFKPMPKPKKDQVQEEG